MQNATKSLEGNREPDLRSLKKVPINSMPTIQSCQSQANICRITSVISNPFHDL